MTTHDSNQSKQAPIKVALTDEQTAGHSDHWQIFSDNIQSDVPPWLQYSINVATMTSGLHSNIAIGDLPHILLSANQMCHINQIYSVQDNKPKQFINAYPCVHSPYGLSCRIERIIANDDRKDAVLRLISEDGSVIYAFDQLYAINANQYQKDHLYYVNFSAWAYAISPSNEEEVVKVEDPEAIRYHRAFNDIIAKNNGVPPDDIDAQIKAWKPDSDEPLAPVEINLGHMCAYLFGETLGQEDEAWCQGQVLGKQTTEFFGFPISVFDVVILREPDANPFVVRMATPTSTQNKDIQVHDYIQANIWLQAAIYAENQKK